MKTNYVYCILTPTIIVLALFVQSCVSHPMTREAETIEKAPGDKALVTFVRPSNVDIHTNFSIWDNETAIGVLSARTYVQFEATPGEHLFIARADNWAYIKADLEAGKHYVVLAKPIDATSGYWNQMVRSGVELVPLKATEKHKEHVDRWLSRLRPRQLVEEETEAFTARRQYDIRNAIAEVDNAVLKKLDSTHTF